MIKATRVDGVFDSDPEKNPNALMFDKISYDEVIEKQLKVMDLPAIILAKDNNLSLKVVNINNKEAILKTIS
jgi:uridylate kinase